MAVSAFPTCGPPCTLAIRGEKGPASHCAERRPFTALERRNDPGAPGEGTPGAFDVLAGAALRPPDLAMNDVGEVLPVDRDTDQRDAAQVDIAEHEPAELSLAVRQS